MSDDGSAVDAAVDAELLAIAALPSEPSVAPTSSRVLSSALWSALAATVNAPLSIVATIVVARVLGAGDFGRFAYYTFVVTILITLADLGVTTALIRAGAHAAGRGDADDLMRNVRAGTTWSIVQIPWGIAVVWVVLPGVLAPTLLTIGVILWLAPLGPSHYLVMTSSQRWSSQLGIASTLLSTAALLVAATVTKDPAVTFAAGLLGVNVLTVVQVFAVPSAYRFRTLWPGPLRLSRADAGFGLGSLLNGQFNNFVWSRSEVLFFGHGQSLARGRYVGAQTIAVRATLLIDVFFGTIPTAFASAQARGEETLIRAFRKVSGTVSLLLMCMAPMVGVLSVTVAPQLFGHGYPHIAGPALAVLGTSLLQSAMYPVMTVLFGQRRIAPVLVGGLAGAAVDLGLAALLVPRTGLPGAVIANAAGAVAFLSLAALPLYRAAAWRRPVLVHVGKALVTVFAVAVVSVPLLWLSWPVGLAVGVPAAALATALLARAPGLRLSADVRVALLDSVPSRLRRPVGAGLGALVGHA